MKSAKHFLIRISCYKDKHNDDLFCNCKHVTLVRRPHVKQRLPERLRVDHYFRLANIA